MPRKIAAVLATTALTAGAGIGVAQAQSDDSTAKPAKPAAGERRGPSAADQSALATKLGVSTARLKEAMDAIRPARPGKDRRLKDGRKGDMAADLATALGVETAAVAKILDANRPAKPAAGERPARGTRPPKPGHAELIAALASGLKLDEAKVKAAFEQVETAKRAAHDAEHAARHDELATKLAGELGLDAAKVKAALEAARPQGGPGGPRP